MYYIRIYVRKYGTSTENTFERLMLTLYSTYMGVCMRASLWDVAIQQTYALQNGDDNQRR